MPPRHGKSELTSKYFPAWHLGVFPEKNIILTSATDDLALDFSAAARDVLLEHGASTFGVTVRGDSQARHRWQVEAGGMMRAAGVGGSIMGRGANGLIVDDYFKNVEDALSERNREKVYEWYLSTAMTRLAPDAWEVVVATRWHKKDLIGCLLRDQPGQWTRVRLPALAGDDDLIGRQPGEALWPSQFNLDWLLTRRNGYVASGYEWMWEALYQQEPPDVLDAEWPAHYFADVMYDEEPELVYRVLALDPSVADSEKSDYQAFVSVGVDGEGTMYVDARLERLDVYRMAHAVLDMAIGQRCRYVLVEANGYQSVLGTIFHEVGSARRQSVPVKKLWHTKVDKVQRIKAGLTWPLANGRLRFKRHSPGAALLLEQLKGFPATKYRDGPDALEMAVAEILTVLNEGPPDLESINTEPTRVFA